MKSLASALTTFQLGLLAACLCFVLPAAAAEDAAPMRLTAQGLDGRPVSLADGKGRTALVIFWSPESLASRKSLSELQRFIDDPGSAKLFVLAISTNTTEDPEALKSFLAGRSLNLPVALRGEDDFGRINEWRLPIVYVFNDQGLLVQRHAGLFNMKILRQLTTSGEP